LQLKLRKTIFVNTIVLGVEHNYCKNPEQIGFFTSTYYGIGLLVGVIPDLGLELSVTDGREE